MEYEPFPIVDARSSRQTSLEIPVMDLVMRLPRGVRVLEVGCGSGVGLEAFAGRLRAERLVGLDIDPGMVFRAQERLAAAAVDAEVVQGDVRDMPFPDGSFDVVLDFGTCYHIARAERAIFEIGRVLTGGGFFVYETRLSQFLSHPVRSRRRALPRRALDFLGAPEHRVLWTRRQRMPHRAA